MGSLFVRFLIFLFFMGLAGFIVGHEFSAVMKIKGADLEIKRAREKGQEFGLGEKHRILLAVASNTWIPGLDQLVRTEDEEGFLVLFSCERSTEDPFADVQGDGISFKDLDDANGNLFICK